MEPMESHPVRRDLSREELIDLAGRIARSEGDEAELGEMMTLFDANVPHPAGSNLIFYPENYDARMDKLDGYNPTPTEVVEKALAYRPITVPPPST